MDEEMWEAEVKRFKRQQWALAESALDHGFAAPGDDDSILDAASRFIAQGGKWRPQAALARQHRGSVDFIDHHRERVGSAERHRARVGHHRGNHVGTRPLRFRRSPANHAVRAVDAHPGRRINEAVGQCQCRRVGIHGRVGHE